MGVAVMDEAGDTGLKFGHGSSPTFSIGLAVFPSPADADACRERIQQLRERLGMKRSGSEAEFHFWDTHHQRRLEFLGAVATLSFTFYSCTILKQRLSGKDWHKKKYMYRRAGIMAIDLAKVALRESALIFDATSSRQFDQEFLKSLKDHAGYRDGKRVILSSRRLESYKDDAIQLIDMLCGAIMADDPCYYQLVRHREGGRRLYPP